MTLEEYRVQLVEKIANLRDQRATKLLIEEADKVLQSNGITKRYQAEFWQELSGNLENVNKRAQTLVEKQAAVALSQIIAAAQAVIAQHQARIGSK